MGFGLIEVKGAEMQFIDMNELQLTKISDPYVKLKMIYERTVDLIDQFHPDEMALEAPFFGKNVQSMLKLGRAQGVAMAAGLSPSRATEMPQKNRWLKCYRGCLASRPFLKT